MENNVSLLPSELAKMRIQKDEVGPTEEAEEEPKRAEFNRRVKKLSHFVRKLNNAFAQAMKSFEHPDYILSQAKDPGDIISEDIGDWLINEIIQAYKELEKLRQWVTEPLSAQEIESDNYLEQYKDMILSAKKQREKFFHTHRNKPALEPKRLQQVHEPSSEEINKQQLELKVMELEKQVNELRQEKANLQSLELTSNSTSPLTQAQITNEDDQYETLEKKFFDEHIQGYGEHKPENTTFLTSGKLKLKSISKKGSSNQRYDGDFPNQIKMITKNEIDFVDTGQKNYGKKGRGHLLVTGIKSPNESTKVKLHHLDPGPVEKLINGGFFHYSVGNFKERSGSDTGEYSCLSDHNKIIPEGRASEEKSSDWETDSDANNCFENVITRSDKAIQANFDEKSLSMATIDHLLSRSESEKEEDSRILVKPKRKITSKLYKLKKENTLYKESMNLKREKSLKLGTYVRMFIEESFAAYLSKVLSKIQSECEQHVLKEQQRWRNETNDISISVKIDCCFKQGQTENMKDIIIKKIMPDEYGKENPDPFTRDIHIIIDMYGPIVHVDDEIRALLEIVDEIYNRNGNQKIHWRSRLSNIPEIESPLAGIMSSKRQNADYYHLAFGDFKMSGPVLDEHYVHYHKIRMEREGLFLLILQLDEEKNRIIELLRMTYSPVYDIIMDADLDQISQENLLTKWYNFFESNQLYEDT